MYMPNIPSNPIADFVEKLCKLFAPGGNNQASGVLGDLFNAFTKPGGPSKVEMNNLEKGLNEAVPEVLNQLGLGFLSKIVISFISQIFGLAKNGMEQGSGCDINDLMKQGITMFQNACGEASKEFDKQNSIKNEIGNLSNAFSGITDGQQVSIVETQKGQKR
jgi:hypothetical protein